MGEGGGGGGRRGENEGGQLVRRGDEVEEGGKMKGGGEDNEYIQIALLLYIGNSPLCTGTNTDIRVNNIIY